MMVWAKILAGLVNLFNAFAEWAKTEQAKADGAAIQRDKDLRAENERIAKADMAAADVVSGGGLPSEDDPYNRDHGKP